MLVWPVLLYRRLRYGYTFRLIRMAQPRYAKVDPADYKWLREYEWIAVKVAHNFYAVRQVKVRGTKGTRLSMMYMHRELIEVADGLRVDHINHNGMDNRRTNLRAVTHSQNMWHRRKHSITTQSKYKGVCWDKKSHKWRASIKFERKKIYLGCFKSEIEAAKAYDRAAKKYHGEFASLNFPQSERD